MNGNQERGYIESLTDMHFDVLREIGNIGSGNAASSLAAMLNTQVDMNIPTVKILDVEELAVTIGGPETQVVGILFTLHEEFEGMMMFITQKQFAHLVLNVLMNRQFDKFEDLGEMDISAIKEVGNIMVSAYMGAISQMTNFKIALSPPSIAIDMAGALLNVPAVEIEKYGDKALFIQDGFINGENQVTSYLILIPEVGYLKKLFQVFGMDV
ncbi:MAG: chemotaxis protein CheC [Oscillospiraceae bacterium]|nr:chemotaxis protein CheC [Oscillospiraceae bacterium]